jgi:CheY-like chemotaxis protein
MISQAEMYDLVEKRPAKNILVIDSDTKTISMIREILKHPRVVIYSSQNAKLALAFLTDMMPDVIVVDFKNLDMPMKSFLNELYSIEGSENCSLVVASSNISKQDVNNRFSLGIDDYVLKPFNPSYFKQKILSFIGIGALQASRPHILNQE